MHQVDVGYIDLIIQKHLVKALVLNDVLKATILSQLLQILQGAQNNTIKGRDINVSCTNIHQISERAPSFSVN